MAFSFPLLSVPCAFVLAYVPHVMRAALWRRLGIFNNVSPRSVADKLDDLPAGQADLLRRLGGAHNNQLETLGMYAAGVVACVARGRDDWQLIALTASYLAVRVAYIVLYAGPPVAGGYLRSLAFGGVLGIIMLMWVKAAV